MTVKKATSTPAIAPEVDRLFFFNPLCAITIGNSIATKN